MTAAAILSMTLHPPSSSVRMRSSIATQPPAAIWPARRSQGSTMPARIIGMIGVNPPSNAATLHVIEGGLSPGYVTEFARAHDEAGFDLALVGYSSSSAEGFLVALYAGMQTKRLGFLVA